jgi:AbiTii
VRCNRVSRTQACKTRSGGNNRECVSLLKEIHEGAVEGSSDLATVLRKCRLLAAKLKHDEFKAWVDSELDGYYNGAELPSYRKFGGQCFGHFSGPRDVMRDAPIAESSIPVDCRELLTQMEMREGIGGIQELLRTHKSDLKHQWPPDACRLISGQYASHYTLIQAWQLVPRSGVVGLLDTVRNKILNFALEIEATNPDAGEATTGTAAVSKEKVTHIFNTTIHGNVANVASGQHIQQSATVSVQQGDFRSLAAYLRDQGVEDVDLEALEKAIKADPKPTTKNFGKRVAAWVGNLVAKSAEGVGKVGMDVATKAATEVIMRYYGMSP